MLLAPRQVLIESVKLGLESVRKGPSTPGLVFSGKSWMSEVMEEDG